MFILAFVMLTLFKTDLIMALSNFNNFTNNILVIFLILTFFFVMFINKKTNKKELKKVSYELYFVSHLIPLFLFSLTLASYFSSYRNSHFYMFLLISIVSVFLMHFMGKFGSLIIDGKMFSYHKVILKIFKRKRIFIVCVILFIVFTSFFIFIFPNIKYEITENNYIFYDENLYLRKTISHEIKDLGINLPISDWIPLFYDDLNISDSKDRIKKTAMIKIKYKNSTKNIDIISLLDNKDLFVGNNIEKSFLMINTNNDIFGENDVLSISLIDYKELNQNSFLEFNHLYKESSPHNFILNYTVINKLALPVMFRSFLLENMNNIENSNNCHLNNLNFKFILNENIIKNGLIACDDTCRTDDSKLDMNIHISGDKKNLIEMELYEPIQHDEIILGLTVTCN